MLVITGEPGTTVDYTLSDGTSWASDEMVIDGSGRATALLELSYFADGPITSQLMLFWTLSVPPWL